MAGEDSKNSGEIGERLAGSFLESIGWKSRLQTVSVRCNDSMHRTKSGNDGQSHGEDVIFLYNNPFYDGRSDVVHVSVKHNINGYSQSESNLRSTLKDHLEELNEIMACAKYDAGITSLISAFPARKAKVHSGLLIWLSCTQNSQETDILSIVSNVQLKPLHKELIYFVDNARANFLIKAINDARKKSTCNIKFYYPNSGSFSKREDERYDAFLPLELIIADIIPILVEKEGKKLLLIYVNEGFTATSYKKIIWLALAFADAFQQDIGIGFPDYNPELNGNDAKSAEMAFATREKNIYPFCFNQSLINSPENS